MDAPWHNESETQKRIKCFSQYGFKTLIIWDNELDNPILPDKIVSFNKAGA